jgi:(2Fe-2S) ferredoxin
MSKTKYLISEFNLLGQLQDLIVEKNNQIKYLKLSCSEQQYLIKLTKSLRNSFPEICTSGCWLNVKGERKDYIKTGKVKLKASSVELAVNNFNKDNLELAFKNTPAITQPKAKDSKPAAKVLVCKKSSCWKRGGKAVCELIEEMCSDRVEVKTTGCLKQCSKGPNLVMLPSKTRYSQVKPQEVPLLLAKHL